MSKDETLRVRVDAETVRKLHQFGKELEQDNPGLDYSLSNLVRAAINNLVKPPKVDPQIVEFRIPNETSDEDFLKFWDALVVAESQSESPHVAKIFKALTISLALPYITALKNMKQAKFKQANAESTELTKE